ncbi:YfiT family bacillithiol transferase [Paenibacillus nasutitermitis]|uniref:Metal-dependent hydrolase n=1 Tax=Paenibacillus nasutitermitis TaxID=1652958 RepID=A0A917E0W2_9BACL|nr:putative metal-dependent hydrolase [Paenibacillus nasutitermitis]GGD87050.1 putative metal-dependent hydrolase [Paenibacillus nasutitermitis]
MEQLRYPIGEFKREGKLDELARASLIGMLSQAPALLSQAVSGLTEQQQDSPYRPDGWTVRQVVHHLADASMNGYIRTKLLLTEEQPMVKPFDEDSWAQLPDTKNAPIELSLTLHDRLHRRWVMLLKSIPAGSFERSYNHPANGLWSLDDALAFFAWHNRHHTTHITSLRKRMDW